MGNGLYMFSLCAGIAASLCAGCAREAETGVVSQRECDVALATRDGSRIAAIVVPADASPAQKYAAEELRDWTEKITGRRMEILDDFGPIPPRTVLIGATRHTAALLKDSTFNAKSLGDDGYRLDAGKENRVFCDRVVVVRE